MCPADRETVLDRSLKPLEEAFRVLDTDGDGIIATSDLEQFLKELVDRKLISKEDVKVMLELGNENVNYEQFLRLLQFQDLKLAGGSQREENNEALRTMFDSLDRNGDGFICAGDLNLLKGSLGHLGLSEIDIEGMLSGETWMTGPENPKVCYEEFARLMMQHKRVKSKGESILRPCRY